MEATLLSFWGASPLREGWTLPRLVRHDVGTEASLHLSRSEQGASVLVLSDLGRLVNIVDFLRGTSIADEQVAAIAGTVGRACAVIHSDATLRAILADDKAAKVLSHDMARGVVFKAAVEPVAERLKGQPDAEHLYTRVCDDYKTKYQECLALGDFTAGTILMKEGDLTPIIVDWEFASIHGRGVNGDIVQFLADLRCAMIADGCPPLRVFTDAFCAAYREQADIKADDRLERSCGVMLGREIVNQAWGVYARHVKRGEMVDLGASCIREVDDMVESLFKRAVIG